MRNTLPNKVNKIDECGIVNLDSLNGDGTHWVCYYKKDKNKYYFDSYGNANPPIELVKYLGKKNIFYNDAQIQNNDDPPICGHLCVFVLNELSKNVRIDNNERFKNIINKLIFNKYGFTKYI